MERFFGLMRIRYDKDGNVPFMPENSGGLNWEKWGGKKSGGCPLSNNGRKFPLQRRKNQHEIKRKSKLLNCQSLNKYAPRFLFVNH